MGELPEHMDRSAAADIHGMLVRGPDGHLYFIPDDALQTYRVPDKGRDLMAEKLMQATPAIHTSIPGHWPAMPLCALRSNQNPETEE